MEFLCVKLYEYETVAYVQSNPRLALSLGTKPNYYIGSINGNIDEESNSYSFNGKIACLLVGKNGYVPGSELKEYYKVTKDYLIDNEFVDQEVKAVDFSIGRFYNLNNQNTNNLDILPLNNSVVSIKGVKPKKFSAKMVTDLDKLITKMTFIEDTCA